MQSFSCHWTSCRPRPDHGQGPDHATPISATIPPAQHATQRPLPLDPFHQGYRAPHLASLTASVAVSLVASVTSLMCGDLTPQLPHQHHLRCQWVAPTAVPQGATGSLYVMQLPCNRHHHTAASSLMQLRLRIASLPAHTHTWGTCAPNILGTHTRSPPNTRTHPRTHHPFPHVCFVAGPHWCPVFRPTKVREGLGRL